MPPITPRWMPTPCPPSSGRSSNGAISSSAWTSSCVRVNADGGKVRNFSRAYTRFFPNFSGSCTACLKPGRRKPSVGFTGRVRARLIFGCALLLVACGPPFPTVTRRVVTPSPTAVGTPQPDPSAAVSGPSPIPNTLGGARSIGHKASSSAAGLPMETTATAAPTTPRSTVTPASDPPRSTAQPVRAPTPVPPPVPAPPKPGIPHFSKVVVVLMENEEYSSIIGNASAPYVNSLAAVGASATQYYAVSHPSLPNYLALTGGSTFGVTTDCTPAASCTGGTSVVEEMAAAGIGWRGYMEDMPAPCAQAGSGQYA